MDEPRYPLTDTPERKALVERFCENVNRLIRRGHRMMTKGNFVVHTDLLGKRWWEVRTARHTEGLLMSPKDLASWRVKIMKDGTPVTIVNTLFCDEEMEWIAKNWVDNLTTEELGRFMCDAYERHCEKLKKKEEETDA